MDKLVLLIVICRVALMQVQAQIIVTDCGGLIQGLSGEIRYEYGKNLSEHAECIWTIQPQLKDTIQFRLIDTGPVVCGNCQYISIYNVTEESTTLAQTIGYFDIDLYTIKGGSLFQVVFTYISPGRERSQGFRLQFEAIGQNVNSSDSNIPTYKIFNQNGESNGLINYYRPASGTKRYEIMSLSLHPEEGKLIALNITLLQDGIPVFPFAPCAPYYRAVTVMEFGWGFELSTVTHRLCRKRQSTTVYSAIPLLVTYHSTLWNEIDEFQLEWKMITE